MAKTQLLSCGGKGPCCHVGYDHRHCEHCDVVVDTRPANWWYQLPYQPLPYRPYQPFWNITAGTYNTFGDVANGRGQTANATLALAAAGSSYNVLPLPDPTTAHVCAEAN